MHKLLVTFTLILFFDLTVYALTSIVVGSFALHDWNIVARVVTAILMFGVNIGILSILGEMSQEQKELEKQR